MNCDEIRRSVQDYVTRELEPESRRRFDAHLVECAECQRELALMTALVSTLDHQPVLEPSPGFGQKVLASLPKQRGFVPSPWWSLALAPVLAGAGWLFRSPLERAVAGFLGRPDVSSITIPMVSLQQAGVVVAAVVGLGLLVAAGAAAFCWQTYLHE
jgi:anti-sigma factor RsiW